MDKIKIAWRGKHFGEEPPLVGGKKQGAGGIFFSGCNLHCVFCQNYQISQEGLGREYSVEELVEIILRLQENGAVNIDLVTPTIWWKTIKAALVIAKQKGLEIPIVWNSNGYEAVEILKQMEGLVDIYLPDFKYADNELAHKYSGIKNYSQAAEAAIKEMHRQAGLFKEENGTGKSGLIVRHMVLPGAVESSKKVLDIIASIDNKIHIALMNQYNSMFHANRYPEINRTLNKDEFDDVYDHLLDLGFVNGWVQGEGSQKMLVPDFRQENPFGMI